MMSLKRITKTQTKIERALSQMAYMAMVTSIFVLAVPVEAVAALDIDSIWFETKKSYRAGTLETDPFDVGAMVFGANINSVQVTSPTDITEVLETDGVNWYWDREEKYATLEDLHQDFPPGFYEFTFNEGEDNEDSVTVWYDPEQPTGFANITYPADGATDVPVTPTFTWGSCLDYGDTLVVVVCDIETDTDPYIEGINIGQTSWTPGPLVPGRLLEFTVHVQTGRPMQLLTTVNGDALNYFDVFDWKNEVRFTVPSEPHVMIAETLEFFDASVESETLVGEGPGNSAEHRLNALRNMLEAASDLIDDGLIQEACQQLRAAYKKCDGQPNPPDFVTGEATEELADMIQDVIDSLGCE